MSRSIKASLQDLKAWVLRNESRMTTIASGQGTAGTRAAPTQAGNNDTKIGSRLDNGEIITKDGKQYKRYNFQINKGAEDKTLKKLANKESHKVWSQADLPLDNADPPRAIENLFDDLEKNLKT